MSNIIYRANGNVDIEQVAHDVALWMVETGEIPTGGEIKPEDLSNAIAAYIQAHPEALSNSTFGDTFRWVITDGNNETGGIDTATGQNKTQSGYTRTGYVPVDADDDIFGGYCTVFFYDADKNYLGYYQLTASAGHLGAHVTLPTGTAYVRASGTAGFKCYRWKYGIFRSYIYNYSSTFSPNSMFSRFKDDYSKVGFSNYLKVNRFGDKKVLVLGDSFSAGGNWQRDLEVNLHCQPVYNYSKNGGRITDTYDPDTKDHWIVTHFNRFKTENPNVTPDAIIICLGTNDTSLGTAGIGSFNPTAWVSDPSIYDTTKFYGGLQYLLCRMMTDFPDAVIYCGMTPMAGLGGDLTTAYSNAMKDVCDKYGVRYIDTNIMQVNPYVDALAVYRSSKSDGHPSHMGQHRLGRFMAAMITSGWYPMRDFEYGANKPLPID